MAISGEGFSALMTNSRAYVTLESTSGSTQYQIADTDLVIGRHPECDIVVDVGAVSRRHAKLTRIGGKVAVEDLKSRNGTYVNGQPIGGTQFLHSGDRIRVCDIELVFQDGRPTTPGSSSGSGQAILVDDDPSEQSSTIMSKLDVSSEGGSVRLSATPDVKLNALLEITKNLSRTLALDQVLPQLLESLFKIFVQADRGFIVLRDASGMLVPRWTKLRRDSPDQMIRISRTIVNSVVDSKQAILSADAAEDSRFEMSQSIADFRIRSMMCAPLLDSEGNSLGAIQVDTVDQRHRFRAEDLELLVAIASQAAIAIENAHLHESVVRQRELERDLQAARQVQRGFLPTKRPDVAGHAFYDFYEPADQVGGDYFDYVPLADGRTAIVVADVTGHGIQAALVTAKLSATIRFCLASESAPGSAITRVNETFQSDNLESHFITLLMMVLDPNQNELTVVNAGHMPPIWRKASGNLQEVGTEVVGLPLLVTSGIEYQEARIPVDAGDLLVAYTDGLSEAANEDGEQFSISRMEQLVQGEAPDVERTVRRVIDEVKQFIGKAPVLDDMCLVGFGRTT